MDVLSSLLQLATPIGLAFIALIIVRENQKDRAGEILRRDAREDAERDRQAKNDEKFMLLFATITTKQEANTAQVMKSGVDSEARVSSQLTTAESNIKGRVNASAEAITMIIEKLYKLTDNAFQVALASDPQAAIRFDKALEVLTAQMEAVKDDLAGVKSDSAANTDARMLSTQTMATVPADVVITDVSPSVVESIVGAVTMKSDSVAADEEAA
jgi:hypothetical protein